ncbi:hypothetical protein TWF718_001945 [Orbilia javanica]|uniref:Uncharacterized protein n=1 Tax=Orbilia javanica TaxID=47235 RepID=A0AAN8MVY9_9PEZI
MVSNILSPDRVELCWINDMATQTLSISQQPRVTARMGPEKYFCVTLSSRFTVTPELVNPPAPSSLWPQLLIDRQFV